MYIYICCYNYVLHDLNIFYYYSYYFSKNNNNNKIIFFFLFLRVHADLHAVVCRVATVYCSLINTLVVACGRGQNKKNAIF